MIRFNLHIFRTKSINRRHSGIHSRLLTVTRHTSNRPTQMRFTILTPVKGLTLPIAFIDRLVPRHHMGHTIIRPKDGRTQNITRHFTFTMANSFNRNTISHTSILLDIDSRRTFHNTLRRDNHLLRFFLRRITFNGITNSNRRTVFITGQRQPTQRFTRTGLPIITTSITARVTSRAVTIRRIRRVFTFIRVSPSTRIRNQAIR